METYPPMFLPSSSSSSPPPPPFMAMDAMSSHGQEFGKLVLDDELAVGNGFLGLMPGVEARAPSSSNIYSNKTEGAASYDSRDGSLVFGGSGTTAGEPRILGRRNGDRTGVGKMKGKVRKPRYAFQTRSHVDILDDGYRWRKYGQKAVKNNKFPRSYYRCTFQGCNVKKQVQRLTGDEGVVVTTYEGMHSHPIEKSTDNFEHILSQFQIYTSI